MRLLRNTGFWGALVTILVIAEMDREDPHSFWTGFVIATVVMAFWWGVSELQAQIRRHALETELEQCRQELSRIAASKPFSASES